MTIRLLIGALKQRKVLRLNYVLATFFATGILAAIFFFSGSFAEAGQFCVTRNNQQHCFINFKFRTNSETQSVDRFHLTNREPAVSKFWPLRDIGPAWGFRNRGVRVSDWLFPKLELIDRIDVDNTVDTIVTKLRISGRAGEYWYYPQQTRLLGGSVRYFPSESRPAGVTQNCSCQTAIPVFPENKSYLWDLENRTGYITSLSNAQRCGFFPAQNWYSASTFNYFGKTSDPNDCYYKVHLLKRDGSGNLQQKPYYFLIRKIPAFTLEEITHNDKWHTQQYLAANETLGRAKTRLENAKRAYDDAGVVSSVQRFRIFWRCGVGKECNYISSEKDNRFEQPEGRYIQKCDDCDRSGSSADCRTDQGHIPWNVFSCYDEYRTDSKSQSQVASDRTVASIEKTAAGVAVNTATIRAQQARQTMEGSLVDAAQRKQNGTYYPYGIYSGDPANRPGKPYFMMLYNEGEKLPKAYPAYPTGAPYLVFGDGTANHGCRVGGYFKDIERQSDGSTYYTLEARGTAKNSATPQEVAERKAADRGVLGIVSEGRRDFPVDGAECRLTMKAGLFDTDVTYFYSVGPVETPPVEIRSFSVSGNDLDGNKRADAGLCSSSNVGRCLGYHGIPEQDVKNYKLTQLSKRPNRNTGPQGTINLTLGDDQNARVSVVWDTRNAVYTKFAKRDHFNIFDPNGKNEVRPLVGNELTQRLDDRLGDEEVGMSGKKDYDLRYGQCVLNEDGKQNCQPATYSFFIMTRNDRALGKGEDANANIAQWLVAQRLDVNVSKKGRDLGAEMGKCYEVGLELAQKEANDNWGGALACNALGAGVTWGLKAAIAASTGGASAVEEAASGGISPTGILTNALGGLVGGGCTTGILLNSVNKFTKPCNLIWVDPKSNPAGAFWTGFGRSFFPGLFRGFFQSFFGGLFDKLSCIPVLDTFFKGLLGFIGGTVGGFIGDMVANIFKFDANSFRQVDKGMLLVGGLAGGTVGTVMGGVIEQSLGLSQKAKPFLNGLGKMLGASGDITAGPDCPKKPDEPTKYYVCVPDTGTCIESPTPTANTSEAACQSTCPKPPEKLPDPEKQPKPIVVPPPALPKPNQCTKDVGLGWGFYDPDKPLPPGTNQFDIKWNARYMVANALMSAVFVVTNPLPGGPYCYDRMAALKCANKMSSSDPGNFNDVFGKAKQYDGNFAQQDATINGVVVKGQRIANSVFQEIRNAAVLCASDFLNLKPCACATK